MTKNLKREKKPNLKMSSMTTLNLRVREVREEIARSRMETHRFKAFELDKLVSKMRSAKKISATFKEIEKHLLLKNRYSKILFAVLDVEYPTNQKKIYERQMARKAERRSTFEKTYTVICWFDSEGLNADYGSYECEKCERIFNHSPRQLMLGAKKIGKCLCGWCSGKYGDPLPF